MRQISLFVAVFLGLATALFGVVTSAIVMLQVATWQGVGVALTGAGALTFVFGVGVGSLGTLLSRTLHATATTLTLFCLLFLVVIFTSLFFPVFGAIAFFATALALALGAMGSFFGVIDAVAPVMRRSSQNGQLVGASLGGQVLGALCGFFVQNGLTPEGAMWIAFLGTFVVAVLVGGVAMSTEVARRPQISKAEQKEKRAILRQQYSLVTVVGIGSFVGFALFAQGLYLIFGLLQQRLLTNLLPMLVVAFACGALLGLVVLGLSRLWLWRYGTFVLIMLYPVLLLIPLGWWFFFPLREGAALCTLAAHMALIPSLFLPTVRYALTPIPLQFLPSATVLASTLSGSLGFMVGGLGWLFLSQYMPLALLVRTTTALDLLLTIIGVGVALSYRWHWIALLRKPEWSFERREIGWIDSGNLAALLSAKEPIAIELGLLDLLESPIEESHIAQLEILLSTSQPPGIRGKLLTIMGRLPQEQLRTWMGAHKAEVRARALLAALYHQVPLPLDQLSALLQDSSAWVQVVACIAAWRVGLEELASVAWESCSFAHLAEAEVLEMCEGVGGGLSRPALRVFKTYALHASEPVRVAAMHTLAAWIERHRLWNESLWELASVAHRSENSALKVAGMRLMAALDARKGVLKLTSLLGNPHPAVRCAAAQGGAQAGVEGVILAASLLETGSEEADEAALSVLVGAGKIGASSLRHHLEEIYQRARSVLLLAARGAGDVVQARFAYEKVLLQYETVALLQGDDRVGYAFRAWRYFGGHWSKEVTGVLGRWVLPNLLLRRVVQLNRLLSKIPPLAH